MNCLRNFRLHVLPLGVHVAVCLMTVKTKFCLMIEQLNLHSNLMIFYRLFSLYTFTLQFVSPLFRLCIVLLFLTGLLTFIIFFNKLWSLKVDNFKQWQVVQLISPCLFQLATMNTIHIIILNFFSPLKMEHSIRYNKRSDLVIVKFWYCLPWVLTSLFFLIVFFEMFSICDWRLLISSFKDIDCLNTIPVWSLSK